MCQNMRFLNNTGDATISCHWALNRSMTQNLLASEISTSSFEFDIQRTVHLDIFL